MATDNLKIENVPEGALLLIEVKKRDQSLQFEANVIEVDPEGFYIPKISSGQKAVGFEGKVKTTVYHVLNNQLYAWSNPIIRLVRYNGRPCHFIEVKGDGAPANRRHAYRQYIGENMPLLVYNDQDVNTEVVLVRDLSELGFTFLTKKELAVGDKLRLRIQYEAVQMNIHALIIRSEVKTKLGLTLFGCKFTETDARLSQYIMEIQRLKIKEKNS